MKPKTYKINTANKTKISIFAQIARPSANSSVYFIAPFLSIGKGVPGLNNSFNIIHPPFIEFKKTVS